MKPKYDIVAIGSATRDAFFESDFKIGRYPQAPSGRAIILPFGEKLGVKKAYFTIGGNAANAAATFARQGLKTAAAAPVGDDVSGEEIKRRLQKEGVDVSNIVVSAQPTAYSVLLLEKGERTILNFPGASNKFSLKDIPLSRLAAKWWYVSLPGESHRSFGQLVAAAKKMRVRIALNPSMNHIVRGRRELLRLLPEISFLVLNESEASALTGVSFKKAEAVFRKLDRLMPGVLAVTSGPRGVTVSDGRFIYHAGVFKERTLADRTGAGDAFGAGFVAGLMRKNNIEYAIRLASANATATVEKVGATEGLLTRREFESGRRWRTLKISKKHV